MDGVLCVNKPKGFTSFDVIAKLRGITKIKRVGHAGTLDPLATGVLPVFLGRATRAIDLLPDHNKAYTADFILGIQTDTQDSTGQVCTVSSLRATSAQVRQALTAYQGEIVQMVPMFSAVHVGGRRLYQLAHQGDMTQDRPKRTVRVETIRLLQFDYQSQSGQVELACSSGTYVRTLLHDLGQDLGCDRQYGQ